MLRDFPLKDRFQAITEELAGFLLSDIINPNSTYNGDGDGL